jgi:hypothetical protein
LIGDGASTVLKAGDNNMIVARFSDSHCSMQGFSIDGNSKNSVWALGVVPQDMTQTSTVTFQLYNEFTDIYITGCDEGIAMRTGPDVASVDSGCWYNSFINVFIIFTKRGIWLMDCPVGSSGVNRNYFTNMRIGQQVNTGVQIDDGVGNTFTNVHTEGIQTGTSPNAVPTGFLIKNIGASTSNNDSNKFVTCIQEAVTRSLNNDNEYSEFYGCEFSFPYSMVLTKKPLIMIGSQAYTPQFLMTAAYQTNSQVAGIPDEFFYPAKLRVADKRLTDYQRFDSVQIGTVIAGGSTTITVMSPLVGVNGVRASVEIAAVFYELVTFGSVTVRAHATVEFDPAGLIQAYGLGTVTYNISQGLANYTSFVGLTMTMTNSGNNVQLTFANAGANNLQQGVLGLTQTINPF